MAISLCRGAASPSLLRYPAAAWRRPANPSRHSGRATGSRRHKRPAEAAAGGARGGMVRHLVRVSFEGGERNRVGGESDGEAGAGAAGVAAQDAPRVIVVGAGFAGLAAVAELVRAGMRVMLIDRNVYSTFQPLLYQVATGGLNPGDIAYPVRAFTRRRGARFRPGELTRGDTAARRITLAAGGQFEYDYLILATGVSAAHYGGGGAAPP